MICVLQPPFPSLLSSTRPQVYSKVDLGHEGEYGQPRLRLTHVLQCTAYNEHRKLLIQEMNLTHFTGSEEEQFTTIMTPTKEEDFESLGQYILKCLRT